MIYSQFCSPFWFFIPYQFCKDQGRSQPHSPGWARVPLSSFFPQILINFSSNFTYFLPHFGPPGGRLAHPGRLWLRHWQRYQFTIYYRGFLFGLSAADVNFKSTPKRLSFGILCRLYVRGCPNISNEKTIWWATFELDKHAGGGGTGMSRGPWARPKIHVKRAFFSQSSTTARGSNVNRLSKCKIGLNGMIFWRSYVPVFRVIFHT